MEIAESETFLFVTTSLNDFLGDFLDLDTAFGGGHEDDTARGAIDDSAQIQLAGDIGAVLDQDLGNRLTFLVGLIGHQVLAQPLLGECLGGFGALDQLDATSLAAAASLCSTVLNRATAAVCRPRYPL